MINVVTPSLPHPHCLSILVSKNTFHDITVVHCFSTNNIMIVCDCSVAMVIRNIFLEMINSIMISRKIFIIRVANSYYFDHLW